MEKKVKDHKSLNIVLHCRERSNMKLWIHYHSMKEIFLHQSNTTLWLLRYLIGKNASILREFLFHSGDALARGTFVQLIIAALTDEVMNLIRDMATSLPRETIPIPYWFAGTEYVA
jgi:hypothetical protein